MYILVIVFGVLNIVTALFTQSMMHIADVALETEVKELMLNKTSTTWIGEIYGLLQAADSGQTGKLNQSELQGAVRKRRWSTS